MEDREIVELYLARDESAVRETQRKYGGALLKLTRAVLGDPRDSEETVNDACLRVWQSIPPDRPQYFGAYLSKIARRLAVDRLRRRTAGKRGGGEYDAALDELEDCVAGGADPADEAERAALTECVNRFLDGCGEKKRSIFLQRYFYALTVREIAEKNGLTEANVKVTLSRLRGKLKEHLIKEGY